MKHISSNNIICLIIITFTLCINSCSDTDDIKPDVNNNPNNQQMVGTKWTVTNWDYGLGEDWISTLNETICFYFYSSTEGLIYYGRKDVDSDFGSSNDRHVAFFTFNVNENQIKLDYITDPLLSNIIRLTLNENTISANGYEFSKGTINANDYTWIASLHGTTGACQWYHDLRNAIWITGNGRMANYTSYNQTPWGSNNRAINLVFIDDGVTSIGAYAFANASIGDIELPSSLNTIEKAAFADASITSITLYDNIRTIEDDAFAGCKYLSKVSLPQNVEEIGNSSFANCKSAGLAKTNKLRRIGDFAFMGCEVTSWTPSEVLEKIGNGAFSNCDFSEIKLPRSLTTLGHLSFEGNNIKNIYIENGLTNITGTPFYPNNEGAMYVNKKTPIELNGDIIDPEKIGNWILYVPKGCKTTYSQSPYWKHFKYIYESETLTDTDNDDYNEEITYNGFVQGHEYIDLGLSVKWATCNVGATSPEEYGDYYCWGKTSSDADTPSIYSYTPNNICGTDDDVAHELWGNKWKIPNKEQFNELIENCSFSITKLNGKNVIKVTSDINGQSIVFPLTGYKEGFYERSDTKFESINKNEAVYFMTSEIFDRNDSGTAKMYYFYVNRNYLDASCDRYFNLNIHIFSDTYQLTVRPVTD